MKNLLFAILLTMPCVSISQVTQDSLKIAPAQVKNVYNGLKQGEAYKKRYSDCLEATGTLNTIIQQQNDSLVSLSQKIEEYDYRLNEMYDERERAAVEIQKIKSEGVPWWRSPWLYGAVGLIGGILIAK